MQSNCDKKRILIIESSGAIAGTAVFNGDQVVAAKILDHGLTHSQKLMHAIEDVMRESQTIPQNLDYIAVSNGPGSFTGLRIGLASAKGIALAVGKPIVTVNTLDAIAYNALWFTGLICPMIDARNHQVYTAFYLGECGKSPERISDYMAISIADLSRLLKKQNQAIILLGDGSLAYGHELTSQNECRMMPYAMALQNPISVGLAALDCIQCKENIVSAFDAAPFYLRKSQAEQQLKFRSDSI